MGDQITNSERDADTDIDYTGSFASSELFQTLFDEGMELVKEAAAYLDGPGRAEAQTLGREGNLLYTKESMLLTTRLMQLASWLLVHRAVGEGELTAEQSKTPDNLVVVEAPGAQSPDAEAGLPVGLIDLIRRGRALQERIARLDKTMRDAAETTQGGPKPVRGQLEQLAAAFSPPETTGDAENS